MILRRLSVRNFRRFASFEASFAPGLNVILGKNEEGKSTLRHALTLALFQDVKTTDKKVLTFQTWGAAERFALELEMEEDGKRYLLRKDFQSKTARLEDRSSGEALQDGRAIDARIRELLGLPSLATFESTVRISQRDMTRLQASKEIADQLQTAVTGGEQDVQVSRVLGDLDKALNALKSAAKSNPGPLALLPDRIALTEATLAARRQSLARAEESRAGLAAIEQRLEEARTTLERRKAVRDARARRLDLESKLEQSRKEEARLHDTIERIRDLGRDLASARSDLRSYDALLTVPAERIAEMARLEGQVAEGLQLEHAVPAHDAVDVSPRLNKGPLALGLILGVLGLAGGLFYSPLFLLLVLGLSIAVWEIARYVRDSVNTAARVTRLQAREKMETARRAAKELQAMLGELGCAMLAEFREKRAVAEQMQRKIDASAAVLHALLSGESVDELEEERRAASRTVHRLEEQLEAPEMRLAQVDQLAYQELLREILDLETEIEDLERETVDLRVDVGVQQVGADEIHALEEQLEDLHQQLAAAQERQQVLLLTRQVLDESRAATMVSAQDVLQTELGSLIDEITSGRYRAVDVDPKTLGIKLLAPGRDGGIAVEHEGELSTGTVDQVYLAARLALAKLLAQGRRPPLILDDPFVTFDPSRTAAVLSLCKRLATEHQILLFTCQDAYASVADHVVRLPALSTPG